MKLPGTPGLVELSSAKREERGCNRINKTKPCRIRQAKFYCLSERSKSKGLIFTLFTFYDSRATI
jgi:hypothetical protein